MWELLTQVQKDMLTKIRREDRGMFSNRNDKNIHNSLKVVNTILKNPDNNQGANINKLSTSSYNSPEEEE